MAALFTEEAAAERACGSKELKERVGSASARSTCHAHAHITARGVKPSLRGQSLALGELQMVRMLSHERRKCPSRSRQSFKKKGASLTGDRRGPNRGVFVRAKLNCERDDLNAEILQDNAHIIFQLQR